MTYPGSTTYPGLLTFPGTWELNWPPSGIIPVSVARRPQATVSVAPRGSVPARVPWRPRIDVDVPMPVEVLVTAFPEIRAEVTVPLNLKVDYVADATGGSVSLTVPVSMPVAVTAERVPYFEARASMPVNVQVYTTMLPAKFRASGLTKSGTQTLSVNTWTTVTNWSVRSGFPDTQIVSHGVQVPDQAEIAFAGQLTFGSTDSMSGGGLQMRVMAGSTELAAAASAGNSAVAELAPFTWKNETGGTVLVTVQARTNSTLGSREIIQATSSWLEMKPVVPLVTRASDDFNRPNGALGSDWFTTGGGTLKIANQRVDGIGTPSVPLSYAWWHEPMPSNTQVVRGVVRWDGANPEHSACGLVVRANPNQNPVTNPGTQYGVQFSWTRGIMALYYEDYDAPNGFVPVTGVPQYVSTTKFPEGAVVELRAEGNLYTARVNGVIQLQGTVSDTAIPFTNRYVGVTIQDDSAVQNGGGPPGRIDDFEALTPEE